MKTNKKPKKLSPVEYESELPVLDEILVAEDMVAEVEEEEEEEEETDVIVNYNDEEFKKAQLRKAKESDIAITLDNFDLLLLKYRPVILSNIRNIKKMYSNYPQIEFDDLFQEASMALYQSIENFDSNRGIFFGVYLKVAISNKLKCFCRNFLPHIYKKDEAKSLEKGKTEFKRVLISVSTLDDYKSYLI